MPTKKPLPGTAGAEVETKRLEDDLRRELQIEGFARADTGSSVEVTDGVAIDTAAGGARARSQVDSVEEIKHLGSKLDLNPFGHRDVFEDRKVHIGKARPINCVSSHRTQQRIGQARGRR